MNSSKNNFENPSHITNITMYNYNSTEFTLINDKIDHKIREIHQNRQLIININNLEEFSSAKLKLTQFLFGLEDELLDYLRKYKNLFIQNKELNDKCENYNSQIRNLDHKLFTCESISDEYKNNINELHNQINFLKEKNYSKDDYIKNLEEKLKIVERNLNLKNNVYMENFSGSGVGLGAGMKRNNERDFNLKEIKRDYNDLNEYENNRNYSMVNNNNISLSNPNNLEKLNYYEKYNTNNANFSTNNNNDKDYVIQRQEKGDFVKGFLNNYNKNENNNDINNINNNRNDRNENLKEYKFDDNNSNITDEKINNIKNHQNNSNIESEGEKVRKNNKIIKHKNKILLQIIILIIIQ